MKRSVFSCISAVAGLAGFLLALCGVISAPGTPGPARSNWWRVVSVGMIMMGLSMYPYRNQKVPDYVPEWVNRFAPAYVWVWIILGVAIFLLSWL